MSKKVKLTGWLQTAHKVTNWVASKLAPKQENGSPEPEPILELVGVEMPQKQAIPWALEVLPEPPDPEPELHAAEIEEDEEDIGPVYASIHGTHVPTRKFAEVPIGFLAVLQVLARNIPDPQLMQIAKYLEQEASKKQASFAVDMKAAAEWIGVFSEKRMRGQR